MGAEREEIDAYFAVLYQYSRGISAVIWFISREVMCPDFIAALFNCLARSGLYCWARLM